MHEAFLNFIFLRYINDITSSTYHNSFVLHSTVPKSNEGNNT